MQRADMAGSTRYPYASSGNAGPLSAGPIVLELADTSGLVPLSDEAVIRLGKCRTLVRAIDEVVEEAADEQGVYARFPGYERGRLKHVNALIDILDDELNRLSRLMEAAA